MKRHLGLGVVALMLAACSPAPEPATEEAATGGAVAAKRMPLPDCAEVEAKDNGADGWQHPDCRLMFPDDSGLAIEARYTPAEDESTKITVQVVQPGDATIQTIEERMGNTFNGPTLADFDKDGKVDIQLPLETGNVNTARALWRQVEGQKFVRIGEPSGVEIEQTASGYLAVQGRSSASEYYVTFYRLVGDELMEQLTARVTAQTDGEKITGVACDIEADEAFGATGLALEAAKAQFCAESPVQKLVKDMTPTP